MIRSILYLDEPKLLSFSSQVLKGLTEYFTREASTGAQANEEQKGPIGSGKILADALHSTETAFERRVLHDHAFSIFEEKLAEDGLLLDADTIATNEDLLQSVSKSSFIRIKAPARFVDAAKLASLLGDFNRLGAALAYTTNHDEIIAAVALLQEQKALLKDKSKHAALDRLIRDAGDPNLVAQTKGLHQDPVFLESLRVVTEFGYSDQIEVQQMVRGLTFSACLKRDSLRESEALIMRKYSRKTEKSLVVLGVVTQTAGVVATPAPESTPGSMKEALNNMIEHIAAMETSLAGKGAMEVVIDPIAVYASL